MTKYQIDGQQIGDRVWHPEYGWGNIVGQNGRGYWWVELDEHCLRKVFSANLLFFEEFKIPESALKRPKPRHEFQPGDPVIVWNGDIKHLRVFVKPSEFSSNMRMMVAR